jgi:molybdopterin-containing oxidoreductase family iron-sulfur binding subunit
MKDIARRVLSDLDRREALKLLAGGATLALGSCGRPPEQVVPYVEMPERLTPGVPLRFASALALGGFARGVIVTSMEGRPIKVDGNPRHPASLGATDIFAEAAIMSLADPDRLKTARKGEQIAAWSAFEAALLNQMEQERARHGAGLCILTNRVTSPTLRRQIDALIAGFPEAKWYRYEPIDDDAPRAGATQAFGRALTAVPRFADARVVLALDTDPLGSGPEQVRFAHDFVAARQARTAQDFLRLYAVEAGWTLTGANADHRLALQPILVRNVALAVAGALGATVPEVSLPPAAERLAHAAAADLKARAGQALVLAGRRQPPEVHALCHWINAQLRAPVDYIDPIDPAPFGHAEALRTLADELSARKVETLLIVGANPAYDAPGELRLGEAIAAVPFSARLGLHDDETAGRCTWRLPLAHPLETWSDLRAHEGSASIVQPLIRPLYDSRTAHQLLALVAGGSAGSGYDEVRATWAAQADADFDGWWRRTLQDGVVADSAAKPVAPPAAKLPSMAPAANTTTGTFALTLDPDPSLWDGSDANNALLQECPKPLVTQVWGNALHVSAADARRLGLVDGSAVRLQSGSLALEAPILVRAGQAAGTIAASLGHGRTRAGAIGNGIGFDVYAWRKLDSPWLIENVTLALTGRSQNLLLTQHHFALEGEARDLQPRLTLADLAHGYRPADRVNENLPTLYAPLQQGGDGYAWAMAIDTTACTGCNACVVACQAENNVPVVGPDEIAMGRDMHWLRIDAYAVDGRPGFSPTPCMHCEHAPCEPVCPVAASVHDFEGLNVQVYNRCVGTRFCESNCPYKVRRFNFFGYADGQEYADLGADSVKAAFNPDVTVRTRGVMEKCTYCVQRISRARRASEKEDRRIRDGEVVTACQAACPTRAIRFGNLNDAATEVVALREKPESYALLGHLGTRPRTTYLARLRNPNPALDGAQS